jgi:hypothetical protein
VDIRECGEWAQATNAPLEVLTDHPINDSDDQPQSQKEHQSTNPCFPEQQNAEQNGAWREESIATHKWHQDVKERVCQTIVDGPENPDVQSLQPIHPGASLSQTGGLESQKLTADQ